MKKVFRVAAPSLFAVGFLALSTCVEADNLTLPTSTPAVKASVVDDGDAGWIWNGMTQLDDPSFQGGGAHAGGPGTYGAYTFHGTAIDVTGMTGPSLTVDGRVHKIGRVKVSLDGKPIGTVSAITPDTQYAASLIHVAGLSDANHVLQIEPDGGWIAVDTIKITQSPGDTTSTSASDGDKGPAPVLPAGQYRISLHMDPSKYLSAHDVYPVDGTVGEIYHFADDRQQIWTLQPLDGGLYRISPWTQPDQALSVLPTFVKSTGYAVGTWHYTGSKHQQWIVAPTTGGFFRIISAAEPANVIELMWSHNEDGTNVIEFQWHGSDNQEWAFKRITP